jgi:4-amino-4-deoxy-L-arabinose transferase-like glycosyltransferase
MTHLLGLPIFTDEMAYIRTGDAVARGQALLAELHYGHPPLFSWMEAAVSHLVAASPLLAGRLTAGLCGIVTCMAVMLSAAEFGLSWLVPLSGLAYALCPYTVMWDRMALLDGPLAMWGSLALYVTLRAYASATDRQLTVRLVFLGLAIGCGMYTKVEALAFTVLPILLALCHPRTDLRTRVRIAALPIGTGLLMTAVLLLFPGSTNIVAAMHQHASRVHVLLDVLGQVGAVGSWLVVYLTPLGCIMVLFGIWKGWKADPRWGIVAGFLVLPLVAYTLMPQTFFASRYLVFIAVPGVLLMAFGLYQLLRLPRQLWGGAVLVFFLWAGTQDAWAIINPEQTVFVPFDRYTFVEGWPSGYGFSQAVAMLKRRAHQQAVVIGCSTVNPPGDALLEEFWGWRGVTIVPFETGNGPSLRQFIRSNPGGYIVLDLEGQAIPPVQLEPHDIAVVARYWKPGHRASYVVLQVRPARHGGFIT